MFKTSCLRLPSVAFLAAASVLCTAGSAFAAGYDTPMLYSARNMGMGGAAIGYTDDPSSIFHNPAGLARVKGGALMVNASPLFGTITGSPGTAAENAQNIKSNTTFAPFFLVGAAYRVWDKLVAGFGVYPVASAGASYDYTFSTTNAKGITTTTKTYDHTKLAFIEFAPSLAYEIIPGLRFGVAWRAALVQFTRYKMNTESTAGQPDSKIAQLDMPMEGWNFEGFRVGLQYSHDSIDAGLVFRNKTRAVVEADNVTAVTLPFTKATYQFILPAKLGGGVQWRATPELRLALDVEYALNSENWSTNLAGHSDLTGKDEAVGNIAQWKNSITARVGGGYRLGDLELRLGYIYDTQASSAAYPSAFGTPPGPTMVFTGGLGYNISKDLDVSVAGAYRTGSGATGSTLPTDCPFCGKTGNYEISLFGAYLDVRWRFGEPAVATTPAVVETAPAAAPASEPATAPEAPASGTPQA